MKIQVKSAALRAAFDLVDQMPDLDGGPGLVEVALNKGRLTLTIRGVGVAEAWCRTKGDMATAAFAVNRKGLSALLRGLGGGDWDLTIGRVLELRCGSARGQIGREEIKEEKVSRRLDSGQVLELPGWLRLELDLWGAFTASVPGCEHLAEVHTVQGFGVLATDALSLLAVKGGKVPVTVGIPLLLVRIMARDVAGVQEVRETDKALTVMFERGWVSVPRLAGEKYPETKLRTWAEQAWVAKPLWEADSEKLAAALRQLTGLMPVAAETLVVRVVSKNGKVQLEAEGLGNRAEVALAGRGCGTFDLRWAAAGAVRFLGAMTGAKAVKVGVTDDAGRASWIRGVRKRDKGTAEYALIMARRDF